MPPLIEMVPARRSWRTDFETLKIAVLRAVPAGSRALHIGSTASRASLPRTSSTLSEPSKSWIVSMTAHQRQKDLSKPMA